MTACFPHSRIHKNRSIQTDHVRPLVDEGLPPEFLDTILQLHAERAVIPCIRESAVDLRTGENKTATLTERNELIEGRCGHGEEGGVIR